MSFVLGLLVGFFLATWLVCGTLTALIRFIDPEAWDAAQDKEWERKMRR